MNREGNTSDDWVYGLSLEQLRQEASMRALDQEGTMSILRARILQDEREQREAQAQLDRQFKPEYEVGPSTEHLRREKLISVDEAEAVDGDGVLPRADTRKEIARDEIFYVGAAQPNVGEQQPPRMNVPLSEIISARMPLEAPIGNAYGGARPRTGYSALYEGERVPPRQRQRTVGTRGRERVELSSIEAYHVMRHWNLTFSGAPGNDAETFLIRIAEYTAYVSIHDEDVLEFLSSFLTGIALVWYRVCRHE